MAPKFVTLVTGRSTGFGRLFAQTLARNGHTVFATMRDPAVKSILPELGEIKEASNAKAKKLLGWTPRSNEEAIVASAESLIRLGLLKDSVKKAA